MDNLLAQFIRARIQAASSEKPAESPDREKFRECLSTLKKAATEPNLTPNIRIGVFTEAYQLAEKLCEENSACFGPTNDERRMYLSDLSYWLNACRTLNDCTNITQVITVVQRWDIQRVGPRSSKAGSQVFLTILHGKILSLYAESDSIEPRSLILRGDLFIPLFSPSRDARIIGTKAMSMIRSAGKKVNKPFKYSPRSRVDLLAVAWHLASKYAPPNWGSDENRPIFLAKLERKIIGSYALLDAATWTELINVVNNYYSPLEIVASVLPTKKGAQVFNICLMYKIRQLCANEAMNLNPSIQ